MTPQQKWKARKKAGLPMRRYVKHGLSKDRAALMKWWRAQKAKERQNGS